jgi:hypothetical protein
MGVPSFTGVNTMFPEKPEKVRPRAKRFGVEFEEERAWVSFYRRVRHDATLATEVLVQLEADAEMKRTHLALVLCCKEALRAHKARQARECLPETGKEPAVRQVRRLTREAEFAQAQAAFGPHSGPPGAAPAAAQTEASPPRSPQAQATRSAA